MSLRVGVRHINTLQAIAPPATASVRPMFCVNTPTIITDIHALNCAISLTAREIDLSRSKRCASMSACLNMGRRPTHVCNRVLDLLNAQSATISGKTVGTPGSHTPIIAMLVASSPRPANSSFLPTTGVPFDKPSRIVEPSWVVIETISTA